MIRRFALLACLAAARGALAQGQSELEHVPPDPPQTSVHSMPYSEMTEMMGMDDRRRFGKVMLDELEWQTGDDAAFGWDAAAWYGGDFDKVWIQSEGTRAAGETRESRTELLWDRIVTPWWSLRAGARLDGGIGPSRDWASIGFAGTAPGMIDVEAAAYLGESGRSALRLTSHCELRFTQRLIAQPELEMNVYGKDDPERLIGAGISELKLALRVRYEVQREFAPYFGLVWAAHFGDSANLRKAAGEADKDLLWIAGIRAWF